VGTLTHIVNKTKIGPRIFTEQHYPTRRKSGNRCFKAADI